MIGRSVDKWNKRLVVRRFNGNQRKIRRSKGGDEGKQWRWGEEVRARQKSEVRETRLMCFTVDEWINMKSISSYFFFFFLTSRNIGSWYYECVSVCGCLCVLTIQKRVTDDIENIFLQNKQKEFHKCLPVAVHLLGRLLFNLFLAVIFFSKVLQWYYESFQKITRKLI